ncbi:hypothetical protein FRC03_007484, partial [Tulasnella sp. 419]
SAAFLAKQADRKVIGLLVFLRARYPVIRRIWPMDRGVRESPLSLASWIFGDKAPTPSELAE